VRASLPAMPASVGVPDTDEVYGAVALQRLRLHQDQQVPEWSGDANEALPMRRIVTWCNGSIDPPTLDHPAGPIGPA